MKDKFCEFFKNIWDCFKTKSAGFYVGLAALICTFLYVCIYPGSPSETYNPLVLASGLIGFFLFIIFSCFKKTSFLAPISLMITSLLSIVFFALSDGLIDYLSTAFFSGFSIAAIFKLPFNLYFSVISFLLAFILSSVSMYLKQNKISKINTNEETLVKKEQ